MIETVRIAFARLKAKVTPDGELSERTVKSGAWMAAMRVCNRGLQLSMIVVLARLLTPSDFGLMGIGLVTVGALRKLSKIGVNEALIHHHEEDVDEYLDTALVLQVFRGIALGAIIFFGASIIAGVFGEPRATAVLQVMALAPVLVGIRNPAMVYFKKNLEFHKKFFVTMSGSVVQFSVGVVLAVLTHSVWALVGAFVAAESARTVASYLAHSHRPSFDFDTDLAREIVGYGKWITGMSVLSLVYRDGDEAVVGWLIGATALGYYQFAYRLADAPTTEIGSVVTAVTFPSFSKFQDDVPRLRESFFQSVQITTFLAFPAALGIAVVAPTFVRAFLGTEWLPMVTVMQILAGLGFLRSFTVTFGPVWKAMGRPDYETKVTLVRTALLAISIYPATVMFGIEGAAVAVLGAFVVLLIPAIYLVVELLETTYTRVAKELSYPVVASLAMAGSVIGVDATVTLGSPLLEFCLLVASGVGSYALSVGFLTTTFAWGIDSNIRLIVDTLQS